MSKKPKGKAKAKDSRKKTKRDDDEDEESGADVPRKPGRKDDDDDDEVDDAGTGNERKPTTKKRPSAQPRKGQACKPISRTLEFVFLLGQAAEAQDLVGSQDQNSRRPQRPAMLSGSSDNSIADHLLSSGIGQENQPAGDIDVLAGLKVCLFCLIFV